jgi:hypothetical protein
MFTLLAQQAAPWTFQEYGKLIFWGAIVLICCVPSISYYLYKWRKSELETELKRDMIARGMSADEIERVLGARMSSGEDKSRRESRRELKETRNYSES